MLDIHPLAWAVFISYVCGLLLLDLLVFNRKHSVPSIKKATFQSLAWISLGVLTGFVIWAIYGSTAGAEYFTGFIIEKSLSVDNVFVWSIVLTFFAIPRKYHHRVLFWGIFGALVMRFIFITAGVALISRFEIISILLGVLLIYSGLKLLKADDDGLDVAQTRAYKFFTKYVPTTKKLDGAKFLSRTEGGMLKATPLLLCLLVVEVTDLIFAVDSVPAILAVARDPFIIFASNAMAILGLRALYFLFDAIKDKFSRLNEGLAIILSGVGVKMILASEMHIGPLQLPGWHLPTWASLAAILLILVGSVGASILWPEGRTEAAVNQEDKELYDRW